MQHLNVSSIARPCAPQKGVGSVPPLFSRATRVDVKRRVDTRVKSCPPMGAHHAVRDHPDKLSSIARHCVALWRRRVARRHPSECPQWVERKRQANVWFASKADISLLAKRQSGLRMRHTLAAMN